MNQFKIIDETILNYGEKNQLYLMAIRYKEKYFIVIDSRKVRIGALQARSRKEVDVMFFQIETQLKIYPDIYEASVTLKLAFTMKSIREFMFIINMMNKEVEFNDIWKLKFTYHGLETTPTVTDMIFEDKSLDNTIHISFPGNVQPLGYFKAPNADSKFTFYINDYFMNQI